MNYLYAGITILVLLLAAPFISLLSLVWLRTSLVPPELPWAGLKDKRILPKLRASLREVTAKRNPINEGYEKYGKHGKAFVLPAISQPDVALPPSNLSWLVAQPESVLSGVKPQDDVLALEYLAHGPDLAAVTDFTVIRRDLTRQLSRILPDVMDEMEVTFDERLGQGLQEWKDVKIFDVIEATSRRLNNRLFVGLPLCRDPRYISGVRSWEITLAICSALIRYLVPVSLKPLLAPICGIPLYFQAWRTKRLVLPIIRQRLATQDRNTDSKGEAEQPSDILQWLINSERSGSGSHGMSVDDIAAKTILLNFFSVHTVAINTGSALTDILCYSSASTLIDELREEAEAILPRLKIDPRAVRDMTKLDSVIRETLRLDSMQGKGLLREVMVPGGVTTPDGLHLPQGTHVCVVMSSRQRDEDVWGRGDEFVPFRFYTPSKEQVGLEDKPKSAVHITQDFLSFGYGRHACPGRFFAVQAMKIILGHLLTRYEFEPLTERPKSIEIGEAVVPSDETTVKMRKRRSGLE